MANLSQLKREKMLVFLEKLKEQHTDDDSLIAIGEIEKELKDRKSTRLNSSHRSQSRMPSSA